MNRFFITSMALLASLGGFAQESKVDIENAYKSEGYKLVFHDEFDKDGTPDPNYWTFEEGYKRNNEAQYYTKDNTWCENGHLVIEARKEDRTDAHGKTYHYTSSSMISRGKKTGNYISAWKYGRFEVKAKIPSFMGCWPAIWTLGTDGEWPYNGEIDIMEYYPSGSTELLHANVAWGSDKRWSAQWNSKTKKLSDLIAKNPNWRDEYHVWRMDWDYDYICLYVDGELLNETKVDRTINPRNGSIWPYDNVSPYRGRYQYLLLNLALGGVNGGSLKDTPFPCQYLIDYVRIYQKEGYDPDKKDPTDPTDPSNPTDPITPTSPGENLVKNGNFEDAKGLEIKKFADEDGRELTFVKTVPGWDKNTGDKNDGDMTNGFDGLNCWNVFANIYEQEPDGDAISDGNEHYLRLERYMHNGWATGELKQTLNNLVVGHKYELSMLYRFNKGDYNGDEPEAGYQLVSYADGKEGSKILYEDALEEATDWAQIKEMFTAKKTGAVVKLRLSNPWREDQWNENVWADFDEVKLVDLTLATGIKSIINNNDFAPYYTLTGMKIDKPSSKGVYIRNGRKIVVK